MSLQDHKKRVLIVVFVLPILLFVIVKLPPYFFLILLCLASGIGMWEFLRMYKASNWSVWLGVLFSVVFLLLNCLYSYLAIYFYSIFFVLLTTSRLLIKRQPQSALSEISPLVIGILYIPTLLSFHWFIRLEGWQWIVYLYGCIWCSDTAAYYVGKIFGKRKLYPEVSPKKTWEGAYGSLVGGVIASVVLGNLLISESFFNLFIIGILLGFTSILGDLVESMFKRDAGVKDSGVIFSEHGGVLDKIDAMLFGGVVLHLITKVIRG